MACVQPHPRGGISTLWEDVQALAALTSAYGNQSYRNSTRGALPMNRQGALPRVKGSHP